MNTHVDIAEAVLAVLNGATFSLPFNAVRKALPAVKREDVKGTMLTVMLGPFTEEASTRTTTQNHYAVDVAVQRAVKANDVAAIDGLIGLVHEVGRLFRLRRLEGCSTAAWQRSEMAPGCEAGYSTDHLDKLGMFTGVIRLTFRVFD